MIVPWGADRVAELAALLRDALPGEGLLADDLRAVLWEDPDPAAVLAPEDGSGAVAVVARPDAGHVRLLAVHPDARRAGRGRALLAAGEQWLREHGCHAVGMGGEAPFYLWPGVDERDTALRALLAGAGYVQVATSPNARCPTAGHGTVPDRFAVQRVGPAERAAAVGFVARLWPEWVAETERGIQRGAVFLVADAATGAPLGFGCHSVNRAGWVGPLGSDPDRRSVGVGTAIMDVLRADLAGRGLAAAEISWLGPLEFYEKSCGATVSRRFLHVGRTL